MITVAIVANSTWNLWNFRGELIKALVTNGHRVILLAPRGQEQEDLIALGTTFIPLRQLRRSGTNPVRDLVLMLELRHHFRVYAVGVCMLFTIKPVIYGCFAARLAGVSSIPTLTGLGYTFLSGTRTQQLVRLLYRAALKSAAVVFFHNPDDRQEFLTGGLVKPEKARVVGGSGIDTRNYPMIPFEEAEPGRFVFIGRLLADKGVREYVMASRLVRAKNSEASFHVVGGLDPDNPASITQNELNSWIAAGDLVYHGNSKDVRSHLQRASVVVLPSYREGLPRVLLESGASGRPMITTDVPGCREVVDPGVTGWLVPACSAEALARAMTEALGTSFEQLAAMGRKARTKTEEQFDVRKVNRTYLSALNQTIGNIK